MRLISKNHDFAFMVYEDDKKQNWDYISVEKMEELYPNGGFFIVGDISNNKDKIGELVNNDQIIEVSAYSSKLKNNEKCIGYICVCNEDGKDSFIRIIVEKKKSFLWLLLLIPLLILLSGLWFMFSNQENKPVLDENSISYHVEGLENKDPDNISIPVFTKVSVNSKTSEVNVNLANPKGNPCYFKYYIILKENNEEVYHSEFVEPGTAVAKFKLDKKLKPGVYDAMMKVKAFSLADHKVPMNGGDMDIKLVVEEGK